MAAITAPERTAAQHQSLLHCIGERLKWCAERRPADRDTMLPRRACHAIQSRVRPPVRIWPLPE